MSRVNVEVLWWARSMKTDVFAAERVSVDLWDGGRALVAFKGGIDEQGPVRSAQYAQALRIVVRPVGDEVTP